MLRNIPLLQIALSPCPLEREQRTAARIGAKSTQMKPIDPQTNFAPGFMHFPFLSMKTPKHIGKCRRKALELIQFDK